MKQGEINLSSGRSRTIFHKGILQIILWCILVWSDQLTKILITDTLKGNDPFVMIPGVLELRYLENTGAAFSMFRDAKWFFVIVAICAIAVIAYLQLRMLPYRRFNPLLYDLTFLSAGAAGNLIDRISLGYVRDFIYFSLIDFPVFNVADIYVTLSAIVLVCLILFYYKDEDFKQLKSRKH